ncbi:MAG: MATE family efflux transporter [Clostridiales bacterium GWF2_38_85]|nr:MAG: MATE family efflux transporter [Clostridiales bacterium GWF2_38_85]
MTTNLTKGHITKTLLIYSVPMMISIIFQQMYSIVDSIVVGQYVGENALAAVVASFPITMILIAVASGSSIGSSVVIGQLFGAKSLTKMKTTINTALITAFAISGILTVLGIVFGNPLLQMMKTPAEIIVDSRAYLFIYIYGFIFLMVYNVCNGIFTALGNSRIPLYFLIGSSLTNVGLDLFFVIGLNMGVAGAAWATFISQGVAMLLSITVLLNKLTHIHTDEKPEKFSKDSLQNLSRVALPSILQQSFIAIGNLFVQGEINGYGASVIAGYGSAVRLNTFAIMSINTLASGISGFTAQNYGAKQFDRIEKGFKTGIAIVSVVVTPFVIVFLLLSSQMIGIFIKEDSEQAIRTGIMFLRIVAPFYYIVAVKIISDSLLRGSGNMKPFVIATFADLLMRVIFVYILSYAFKNSDILWAAWPIGWCVSMVLSLFYAVSQIKRMKRLKAE